MERVSSSALSSCGWVQLKGEKEHCSWMESGSGQLVLLQKIRYVHVYQKSIQKHGGLNILVVKVNGLKNGWC